MEKADLPTFRRVVVQKRSYAQASIITIAVEDAGRGKIDTEQSKGGITDVCHPFHLLQLYEYMLREKGVVGAL